MPLSVPGLCPLLAYALATSVELSRLAKQGDYPGFKDL
jgi:hypothetical protein